MTKRQSADVSKMRSTTTLVVFAAALSATNARADTGAATDALAELSLEQLANTEVISVSKKPEREFQAAAAVFVISNEDIRRSGAQSLPEALRLAPGVEVARINASQWAVGVRGFTSALSRALLVLIDGRSVYSPLFAGVYWDVQNPMLEEIERIEVVLGPGGTLWGANAVNGVINVITKHAAASQGVYFSAGAGSQERWSADFRYGGAIGENFHYKVYGKFFTRDAERHADGNNFDAWHMAQFGLRTDWDISQKDALTVQSDFYTGAAGGTFAAATYSPPGTQTLQGVADLLGGNVLARWHHSFNARAQTTLQVYYDRTERDDIEYHEARDTFDADLQANVQLPARQHLTFGIGYRMTTATTVVIPISLELIPPGRTDHLFNTFIQDEFTIVPDKLRIIGGVKVEHNPYSGFEYEPNLRLAFTPVEWQTLWVSVSRAVRTPSRYEQDLRFAVLLDPKSATFGQVVGGTQVHSEEVLATEIGYRIRPVKQLMMSIAGFYNHYHNLLSLEGPGTPTQESGRIVIPFPFGNGYDADVEGFEFKADIAPLTWLQLHGAYSFLHIDLKRKSDSTDMLSELPTEGSSPQHQIFGWASVNLPFHFEVDPLVRWVSALPGQAVGAYANLDVRVGWHAPDKIEVSLIGTNLLADHHAEFVNSGPTATQIARAVYGRVSWGW